MRVVTALVTAALVATLAHPALAQQAPPAAEKAGTAAEKTLYERLGGEKVLAAVVDDLVAKVSADKRISTFFAKTDAANFKKLLVEQLCALTGGPCKYTGRDMKTAHKGLGIGNTDFNALVQDLQKSLKKFKVAAKEQNELRRLLGPMKKDIVEKK